LVFPPSLVAARSAIGFVIGQADHKPGQRTHSKSNVGSEHRHKAKSVRSSWGECSEKPPSIQRGAQTVSIETIRDFFGLKRNIIVLCSAVLLVGLGENLWTKFIPKYLEALGAGILAIGVFGTLEDLLDAIYQYPGGAISDRIGRKRALVLFGVIALLGYIVYLIATVWIVVMVGLFLVMASSLSQPAMFALIGDTLPRERRAMGFSIQSILKRLPRAISPPLGGLIILYLGVTKGVKVGLLISIPLVVAAVYLQNRWYVESAPAKREESLGLSKALGEMKGALKFLLACDILARMGQHITKMYLVLFALNVIGINSFQFGLLVTIQATASMLVYIPIARMSDTRDRRPFVAITFLFFALFPALVAISKGLSMLLLAFLVAGLREAGEPSRKAMIVDLASESARGSQVGLYYSIRGFAVMPGSVIGALLWSISPHMPFVVGSVIAFTGLLIFIERIR